MAPFPPTRTKAISLVELLVVVSIVILVTLLVTPAVTGLGRSTALVTGGNAVTNLANLARQMAVTKNTMTALVLLGQQGTPADFRAFIVLEYAAGGGGWLPASPWQTLPDGIVVDVDDPTNCTFYEASPPAFPFLAGPPIQKNPPVTFSDAQVSPTAYAARIYLPNGGLQNPEKPAQIRVIEGFAQGGRIVRTRPGAAGQAANYYDIAIIGATGMMKVSRP